MGEIKDKFEGVLETQDDATKQKLSTLQEKIEAHITNAPLDKLGNSITGDGSQKPQIQFAELMSAAYAKRMSKDIIMQHISGKKNEQKSLLGKLKQVIGDKFTDAILKQKNSYDSVLSNMSEVVKAQFKGEFDELQRAVIMQQKDKKDASQESAITSAENYAENSHYTIDEQKKIEAVIEDAKKFEGVGYKYGGNDKNGIDCSGIWSKAIGEQYKDAGETFGRLTAALFDAKAPDISRDSVEKGDWMFWEDPEGVKKGGVNEDGMKIYHIEMAIGKPYEKNGKWYVKTYGSSSDKHVLDASGNDTGKNGVGMREREILNNHHFAKPPYYAKLVAFGGAQQEQSNAA